MGNSNGRGSLLWWSCEWLEWCDWWCGRYDIYNDYNLLHSQQLWVYSCIDKVTLSSSWVWPLLPHPIISFPSPLFHPPSYSSATNMGHGRPGEVPYHHSELLQIRRCHRPCVRHRLGHNLPEPSRMALRSGQIRWHDCTQDTHREQERSDGQRDPDAPWEPVCSREWYAVFRDLGEKCR